MKKTQYITRCALFCAIGALLPQAFHVFGEAAGKTLLPMHIPAMLAGFIAGPVAGLITGIVSPILSNLITGGTMPILIKVPFMMLEVGTYGLVGGLLYKKVLSKTPLRDYVRIILSVIAAQFSGRIVNAVCTFAAVYAFGVTHPAVQTATILGSVVSGLPGIILQLAVVPPLVMLLKKALSMVKEQ